MADLALLALCLIVLCGVAWVAVGHYNRARRAIDTASPWRIKEHSIGQQHVAVYIEKLGERSLPCGSVALIDPDFEYKIEELRSEARMKLIALNSGVKANQ